MIRGKTTWRRIVDFVLGRKAQTKRQTALKQALEAEHATIIEFRRGVRTKHPRDPLHRVAR